MQYIVYLNIYTYIRIAELKEMVEFSERVCRWSRLLMQALFAGYSQKPNV